MVIIWYNCNIYCGIITVLWVSINVNESLLLKKKYCFIICLIVCVFLSHLRIFHSNGDVTIASEGLQILTFALRSWPLSSEGSWACHTDCDKGHLRGPVTLTPISECLESGAVTTYFFDLGLSQLGFEHPTFHLRGKRSNWLYHRSGLLVIWNWYGMYSESNKLYMKWCLHEPVKFWLSANQ